MLQFGKMRPRFFPRAAATIMPMITETETDREREREKLVTFIHKKNVYDFLLCFVY